MTTQEYKTIEYKTINIRMAKIFSNHNSPINLFIKYELNISLQSIYGLFQTRTKHCFKYLSNPYKTLKSCLQTKNQNVI